MQQRYFCQYLTRNIFIGFCTGLIKVDSGLISNKWICCLLDAEKNLISERCQHLKEFFKWESKVSN